MIDALLDAWHALEDWLLAWADSAAGPVVLAVLSAAESVIFPVPPDPLLIALAFRDTGDALWLAAVTTGSSVAGGLVGHWLGLRYGRPLLYRLQPHHAARVEAAFRRWDFWAIVIAGLTPIPYKVFTIAAGAFAIPRGRFLLASLLGRGLRFFTIGALIYFLGDPIEAFLRERFELVAAAAGTLLVLVAVGLAWRARSGYARGGDGGATAGAVETLPGGAAEPGAPGRDLAG